MARPGRAKPERRRGGAWTLLLAVVAVGLYVAGVVFWDAAPGSRLSLGFGWAAAALLVAVSALSWRKRAMSFASRRGLGRSHLWLALHMHGGALFLLLMLLHSGFGWPDGWVTLGLWLLSVWTVAGGLIGRGLQRWLPRLMTSGLSTEVLYERIPELVDDLRERAGRVAASGSTEILDLFERHLQADMGAPRRRWIYFFDITGGIRERLRPLRYMHGKLPEEDQGRLDELEELYRAKLELDAHFTLQRALRGWLWLHVPTSLLLLVLLALHLWGVLRY